MRADIHERQMELTMLRNERNRVKRRLQGAEAQYKEAVRLRDRLHQQLSKEQQDVVKLGKFSFANKIKEWTGKWDEQMEKEINEVAEAELKYNEAEKTVTDLEAEVGRLRKEMNRDDFLYVDEDWADFLKEKEAWIRQNDSAANGTLQKIADDRVRVRSLVREIDEAYEAGDKAKRALDAALDKLGNAEGLSMWDTFLGGGLIVSAMKYSEMNSSDDLVHRAQRALRHYETELMDVQNAATESFNVNHNDFFTFTDIFFDNIFSDWAVHSRITDAKSKLNSVLNDVRRVQDQLRRKRDEATEELKRLDQQEKDIIVS
jgi:chromosome segregation ATPase